MAATMDGSPQKIDWERVNAVKRRKDALHEDPAKALATKSVSVKLLDTFHKMGMVRGFEVPSDEPEAIGGNDAAPQPTEFLLLSLGFCQMNLIIHCAASMRLQLDDIEITVTGHRDNRGLYGNAPVRPGYFLIEMDTRLISNEPPDRLARLAELAENRCPVTDNLSNPTELAITVSAAGRRIRDSRIGAPPQP